MSETKKQQVKIGGKWQDVVSHGDFGPGLANQYRLWVRYKNAGLDDGEYIAFGDRFEFRDTPAEPEPPKEVYVDVLENGDLHAHRTDPGERTHGSAVRITRRYVLDAPLPWTKRLGDTIPQGEWIVATDHGTFYVIDTRHQVCAFSSGDTHYLAVADLLATAPKDR